MTNITGTARDQSLKLPFLLGSGHGAPSSLCPSVLLNSSYYKLEFIFRCFWFRFLSLVLVLKTKYKYIRWQATGDRNKYWIVGKYVSQVIVQWTVSIKLNFSAVVQELWIVYFGSCKQYWMALVILLRGWLQAIKFLTCAPEMPLRISAGTPTQVTEVYSNFLQSFQI